MTDSIHRHIQIHTGRHMNTNRYAYTSFAHTCIYVYMPIRKYVSTQIYMFSHIPNKCRCIHISADANRCTVAHIYIYTQTYTCMCTHKHVSRHIYICIKGMQGHIQKSHSTSSGYGSMKRVMREAVCQGEEGHSRDTAHD